MKLSAQTVIGVDPGISGALVCIREGAVLACIDAPIESGAGNRNRLSAPVLTYHLQNLIKLYQPTGAALEAVSAMPGQGVSSMFSFGRSLGAVEGVLAALGIATTYYAPSAWKRRYGLVGRPKDASRTRALELFPDAAGWLTRKKDHGRADAILLAHLLLTAGKAA